jgi:predicted nucleic acid-binding protein
MERHAHRALLDRVWDLRGRITAYDAAYVALAEALACPLATCDGPMSRTAGHVATIEILT